MTDGLGREVGVPAGVRRAVSLAPSITEIVFAAGAGDRLVGVTSFCDHPAEVVDIAKVGDTLSPNVEAIVALEPDVVFVSTASQLQAFAGVLESRNIAVFVAAEGDIESVFRSIEQIGEVMGTADAAADTVKRLRRRAATVEATAGEGVRPGVFVQIDRAALYTVGRDSFIVDIVRRAGGDVVTAEVPTAYPKLSVEAAMALRPEVIILSDSADNREPHEAFRDSPAVKAGRVYRVNADIISRPGPRLVDAMEEIAGHLRDGK